MCACAVAAYGKATAWDVEAALENLGYPLEEIPIPKQQLRPPANQTIGTALDALEGKRIVFLDKRTDAYEMFTGKRFNLAGDQYSPQEVGDQSWSELKTIPQWLSTTLAKEVVKLFPSF